MKSPLALPAAIRKLRTTPLGGTPFTRTRPRQALQRLRAPRRRGAHPVSPLELTEGSEGFVCTGRVRHAEAGVAQTIAIGVKLVGVEDEGAVVCRVWHAVTVRVGRTGLLHGYAGNAHLVDRYLRPRGVAERRVVEGQHKGADWCKLGYLKGVAAQRAGDGPDFIGAEVN